MKAAEVYSSLRDEIGPWAKAQGFKRAKTMLSWYRPNGNEYIVFWFQVSRDGWDAYAGSKFTVEFQRSEQPVVGEVSSFRKRLGEFLDDSGREEVRRIQNEIITSLTLPPPDYFVLENDYTRCWYLKKFQAEAHRYSRRDDIWLRYHTPAHLHLWSQFILRFLPQCIQEIAGSNAAAPAGPTISQGREWWRFW